jgi:hypothetical protein
MTPSLEGELNLTNFLLELTDMSHIVRFLTKWSDTMLRKAAAGHLTWSFGVKPFLSDVKKVYQILGNYEDILSNFLSKRGKPQKRHFSKVFEDDTSSRTVASYLSDWATYESSHRKGLLTATMHYTYDCPDIKTRRDKIRALRALLGLRLTAANVWEGIPFSFVVDWFLQVGKFIERTNTDLFPVTLTVVDYCYSYKGVATTERYFYGAPNCYSGGVPKVLTARGIQKIYVRRRTLPESGDYFINRGQFGRNQLALSASLLISIKK